MIQEATKPPAELRDSQGLGYERGVQGSGRRNSGDHLDILLRKPRVHESSKRRR